MISAVNFKQHIPNKHPSIRGLSEPPKHTLVVETTITSSNTTKHGPKQHNLGGAFRHRILTTCWDAQVLTGSKKDVDPALCLFVGDHAVCIIDSDNLASKVPRGNGILWREVGIKMKDNAQSCRWKNYYNKKVNTILASDVEWIGLAYYPKFKNITLLEDQMNNREQKKNQERI